MYEIGCGNDLGMW